jgi:hypothetical protein
MSEETRVDISGEEDGELSDPVLRRALEHAPDRAAAPGQRLSEAIRTLAHEAVTPSLPARPARPPWWQRLFGLGGHGAAAGGGGRMPWNAAFATLLVAVLVTVMWQREPLPGAQTDGGKESAAPASSSSPAAAPEVSAVPAMPTSAPKAAARPEAVPATEAPRAPVAAGPSGSRAAPAGAMRERLATGKAEAEKKAHRQDAADGTAALPGMPQKPAPAPAVPPPAALPETLGRTAPRIAAPAATVPPPSPAPPAPAALAPRPAPLADAAAPAGLRTDVSAPPTFSALSQWTRLRITPAGGEGRSLSRDDARELGPLLGSAALAGVDAQPLSGPVDWRIALERNGEVLAVLELAGAQVRWRESGVPPGTGTPAPDALAALRRALSEAPAGTPAQAPVSRPAR